MAAQRRRGRALRGRMGSASIQVKLMLTYASIIFAVLILLNTYPLIMTQNMMFQSKQKALQGQAILIANTIPVAEKLTQEVVEQSISLLKDLNYARIMVTNETGLVLYDSNETSLRGQYALLNGMVSALHGNDVFYGEYEDGEFRSWAAAPVVVRGRTVGAVYIYDADAGQGLILRGIQNNLFAISLLVCGLLIVISLVVLRVFGSRINALLGAIRSVREGEYNHRVRIEGRDEFSQLGEEFNELTGRLQVTEEARRRFVSDASHELKTPLASIKLLTDSIVHEDMPPEIMRDFVVDIGEAADRLIQISEDLLTLNRLDAGQKRMASPVDLSSIVEKICLLLMPLAQAAHVHVRPELEENCMIFVHEGEISRVVSNLMENAIKYNFPEGEVFVTTRKSEDHCILVVEDTGVGIPEEDLPHIFERFYRVDKARSREAGGTGLGLSIVWETLRVYGAEIVPSRSDRGGLCMTVTFRQEEALP